MRVSKVKFQFEKLETSKRQLIAELETLDESTLHYRPKNKKWNIVQIIFHLNSSESNSVKYITKKSQGGTAIPKSSPINSIKSSLLSIALRFLKWKKPAVLPDPPEILEAQQVMKEWDETRIQLKQLLEKLPEDMLDRNIFRHPAAGRMNVSHALTFMQEHFDHHLKQIEERISMAAKSY